MSRPKPSDATRPTRPSGTRGPKTKAALARRREADRRRARRRRMIARLAAQLPGSLAERQVKIGEYLLAQPGGGPVPSRETVRVLGARYRAGQRHLRDYLDRPRRGRPRRGFPEPLLAFLRRAVQLCRPATASGVHTRMQKRAVALGVPCPSRSTVAREIAKHHARIAAARHGRMAGEIDGLPHATVPAKASHRCWVLDEYKKKVWTRVQDPADGRSVSVAAPVVRVLDAASRATLAVLVVDPAARAAAAAGPLRPGGFGEDEVLAALLSAACPEVARHVTRPLAGHAPEAIRFDNATPHVGLRPGLVELGIDTKRLPFMRPINRGLAERAIQTDKDWMDEVVGHGDHYVPADRLTEPPEVASARATAHGARDPERTVIAVEDLYTPQEAQAALDRITDRYNDHPHRRLGTTPRLALRGRMPRDPRPGRELLDLLPTVPLVVTSEGLVYRKDNRETRFAFEAEGVMLARGSVVTGRVDPLHRGVWVNLFANDVFFEPMDVWSVRQGGPQVAALQAAPAAVYSAQAAAARAADAAESLGPDAARRAAARADGALADAEEHARARWHAWNVRGQPTGGPTAGASAPPAPSPDASRVEPQPADAPRVEGPRHAPAPRPPAPASDASDAGTLLAGAPGQTRDRSPAGAGPGLTLGVPSPGEGVAAGSRRWLAGDPVARDAAARRRAGGQAGPPAVDADPACPAPPPAEPPNGRARG